MLHCGLAPDYVLDRMEPYEMRAIIENIHLRTKEDWERTRFEAYVTAQINSRKKMKPQDLIKFEWEKEGSTKSGGSDGMPSDEEVARLRDMAARLIENNLV